MFHDARSKVALWGSWWQNEAAGKFYKSHHPNLRGAGFPEMARTLSRKHQVLLTRIRLGNCVTRRLLFHMRRSDSDKCDHCPNISDSATHRIALCPTYSRKRRILINDLKDLTASLDRDTGLITFDQEATDAAKTLAFKVFMCFIDDTDLDKLFIYKQDPRTDSSVT